MDFRHALAASDPFRRAKHGFWLFLGASLGVFFLFLRLDRLWLGQEEVRFALFWAPAAAFAIGFLFPIRALRPRALGAFWGGLAVGCACAAQAWSQHWSAPSLGALGALVGAAWALACGASLAQSGRASFSWVDLSHPSDPIGALVAGAHIFAQELGAPLRPEAFGQGALLRFRGLPHFWICIEPLEEPGLARAVAAWRPGLSFASLLRRPLPPVDPGGALERIVELCSQDLDASEIASEHGSPSI